MIITSAGLLVFLGMAPLSGSEPPTFQVEEAASAAIAGEALGPVATVIEPPAPENEGALDLAELDALRGGETIAVQGNTQNLNAVNSGNSVSGHTVGSGDMNINANAFNGYDGIGNFVINTGHNNNLMGSVSVNVMVVPQ